jgi:hypothetical protein
MVKPQKSLALSNVSVLNLDLGFIQEVACTYMMRGMKMDGRSRLSSTFVRGSKTEYETKKMVSVALNCVVERWRSCVNPAIFALPMFARSRKASR